LHLFLGLVTVASARHDLAEHAVGVVGCADGDGAVIRRFNDDEALHGAGEDNGRVRRPKI